MSSELMVINPRRRRRRKAKRSRARHTTTKRRRRRHVAVNPRRRRRHTRRHVARRRHRRNPRGIAGMTGGVMGAIKQGAGLGLGLVVTNFTTGLVIKKVPGLPTGLTTGLGAVGLKLVIGVVVAPMALKALKQHSLARNVALGGVAAVVADLYSLYVQPEVVKAGLGDYQPASLQDYQPAMLEGDESNVALGGTLYEGGAYD